MLKKKITIPNLPKPVFIIVHHAGINWPFWRVNKYHKELWGFKSSFGYYTGYHYYIEYSGLLYKARSIFEEGAHARGYNKTSIGIALQGNFNNEQPTQAQLEALEDLIGELQEKYGIPNKMILGHREVKQTSCPGFHLFNWLCKEFPSHGKIITGIKNKGRVK